MATSLKIDFTRSGEFFKAYALHLLALSQITYALFCYYAMWFGIEHVQFNTNTLRSKSAAVANNNNIECVIGRSALSYQNMQNVSFICSHNWIRFCIDHVTRKFTQSRKVYHRLDTTKHRQSSTLTLESIVFVFVSVSGWVGVCGWRVQMTGDGGGAGRCSDAIQLLFGTVNSSHSQAHSYQNNKKTKPR